MVQIKVLILIDVACRVVFHIYPWMKVKFSTASPYYAAVPGQIFIVLPFISPPVPPIAMQCHSCLFTPPPPTPPLRLPSTPAQLF